MNMNHFLTIPLRSILIFFIVILLSACATTRDKAHIEQAKRDMETGYYKRAMQQLLGPACDGNPQAQYAVGYMYYYGYGATQDTEVGHFWIQRAASQGDQPAIQALTLIEQQKKYRPRDMYK